MKVTEGHEGDAEAEEKAGSFKGTGLGTKPNTSDVLSKLGFFRSLACLRWMCTRRINLFLSRAPPVHEHDEIF